MSSAELGAVVIDALIGAGITDLVLSPGARSAALALAAHRADRQEKIRLHVRIDERVAGYTALGIAKATGGTVGLVTTSGTAVANLAPAAMEARAAGIGLLCITADRPAHLVGTGANQTADQVGALGAAACGVVRLSSESGGAPAWAAGVHRAAVLARGVRTRQPGPVQLNIEFVSPLVGRLPEAVPRPLAVAGSGAKQVHHAEGRMPTVIVAGDATPEVGAEARALAELAGVPLLAEPSSNARAGRCAVARYRELLDDLAPDIARVIVFGHPTLSRGIDSLLSREDIDLIVVAGQAGWHDAGHRARVVADSVHLAEQDPVWLARWMAGRGSEPGEGLTQRHIADTVLASLTGGDDLVFGPSSIVRAADLSPIATSPPRVFANRGLAGIDGVIATATGVALAGGRRTTVLVGDLTAQHDLGALVRPPGEPWPELRIVVVDDGGGSIFRSLEQGTEEYADSFERVFLTPQGVDLGALAASLGWTVATAETVAGLRQALAGPADFIVAHVTGSA